ncbi:hypothetical protein Agabi119p4_7447 [Agaricus bisporus var. burnettii]|uniref:F-box domain-containing protein n=1 Tax=Agaricus bisporus var. burnettii TaxID=192524 RepID=A0A8H7C6W2_AGABI|nr:hypothetical protein Agabi119p4_7447 [Agaricus bisporus var. burnettii]
MTQQSYDRDLTAELETRLAALLAQSQGLSPSAAMAQVTRDLLAHNPYNPPEGDKCPINKLSDKLLVYIFDLCVQMELEEKLYREDDEEEWESEEESEDEYDDGEDDEQDDKEDDDDDDDDENEVEEETESEIPPQISISHVCARWRRLALDTPSLWAILRFEKGTSLDQHKMFLNRAKTALLDIEINMEHNISCDFSEEESVLEDFDDSELQLHGHQSRCQKKETELIDCLKRSLDRSDPSLPTIVGKTDWYTGSYIGELDDPPEKCSCCDCYYSLSEFSEILDLVIPRVPYWKVLDVVVKDYRWMYLLLARLHQCGPADNLEVLKLFHLTKNKATTEIVFSPPRFVTSFTPFQGKMPRLRHYVFWAVHIDWDACVSALENAERANLSYHNEEVRPCFDIFEKMVKSLTEKLILRLSGPKGTEEDWQVAEKMPIQVPLLKALTLWHLLPEYASSLLHFLDTPHLTSLSLCLDRGDYGDFAREMCEGLHGRSKSMLAGLEHLNVRNLQCGDVSLVVQMLDQLSNLRSLELDCDTQADLFFDALLKPQLEEVYCPLLESVDIVGKTGEEMKRFVKAREKAGVRLKKVYLYCRGEMNLGLERWLREHVEEFELDFPAFVEEE